MSSTSSYKQVSEMQHSDGEGLEQAFRVARSAFSTSPRGIAMDKEFGDAISAATRSPFAGIFVSHDTTTGKVAGVSVAFVLRPGQGVKSTATSRSQREEEYRNSPKVELSYLASDRQYRKQGHGSAHVATHIQRAHEAGYVLSLSTDSVNESESSGLKKFYHAQGMRHVRIAGTDYFHSIWPEVVGSSSAQHTGCQCPL